MSVQRTWGELAVGQRVDAVEFPLSLYRLVVAAGANRDFNSIHHNSEYAKATGAGEAYANTLFLQGMWERTVREFIGDAGLIHSIRGFRMRSFNLAGETAVVSGGVARTWLDPEDTERGFAALTIETSNGSRVTVGPGEVIVSVPRSRSGSV